MTPVPTSILREEAEAMLRYILGAGVSSAVVDRLLSAYGEAKLETILLPALIRSYPWMIGFIEPLGSGRGEFSALLKRKLDIATAIGEASVEGGAALTHTTNRPLTAWWSLSLTGVYEVCCVPSRLLVTLGLLRW